LGFRVADLLLLKPSWLTLNKSEIPNPKSKIHLGV